ncbi:MAG: nucleotide sugar dehydrogenase [Actinobacteria bacterium]|nr:nucleotide sugar dehydrogenase [Actinomycetota bacterium]
MKVAIIGQGYVGRSIAEAVVGAGHSAVGFDVNPDVISTLNISGDFNATTDAALIGDSEVIVIAVPTPLDGARKPDLSAVHAACKTIIENVKKPVLVINESTSYPGTLRNEIAAVIEKASGLGHLYASSPERVDPGNEKWIQKNTPRLLAGLTPEATDLARKFYSSFCDEIIEVSTPEVAEAAKLFENTFRQVNIALVNEFAQISDGLDIPTREVLDAAATKPFGFMSFQPGPGVGGHCIPVDPSYLAYVAENVGVPAEFIKRANEVNLGMPAYVVSRVAKDVGSLKGKKVVVVGVSYKANVSDTREAPASLVITELRNQGAEVSWHDPVVGTWNGQSSSELKGFDVAIVVTKHDAVAESEIKASAAYVFDCTGTIKGVAGL